MKETKISVLRRNHSYFLTCKRAEDLCIQSRATSGRLQLTVISFVIELGTILSRVISEVMIIHVHG